MYSYWGLVGNANLERRFSSVEIRSEKPLDVFVRFVAGFLPVKNSFRKVSGSYNPIDGARVYSASPDFAASELHEGVHRTLGSVIPNRDFPYHALTLEEPLATAASRFPFGNHLMRPMDKFVTDFGLRAAMQGDLDFNTPSWGRQFFYLGHYPLMAELVHVFGPETAVKYATEPIRIAARTGNLAFPLEILKSKLRKVGYSSEAVDKLTVGDFGPGLIIEDGCEDGFAHDGFEFQVRSGDKDLVSFLKHLVM